MVLAVEPKQAHVLDARRTVAAQRALQTNSGSVMGQVAISPAVGA